MTAKTFALGISIALLSVATSAHEPTVSSEHVLLLQTGFEENAVVGESPPVVSPGAEAATAHKSITEDAVAKTGLKENAMVDETVAVLSAGAKKAVAHESTLDDETVKARRGVMALKTAEIHVSVNHASRNAASTSTSKDQHGWSVGLVAVIVLILLLVLGSFTLLAFSITFDDRYDSTKDSLRDPSRLRAGGASAQRTPQGLQQSPVAKPSPPISKRSPGPPTAYPPTSQPFLGAPNATPGPSSLLGRPVTPAPMMSTGVSAGSSTGNVPQVSSLLPPICPSLILPRTQARFVVSMASLHQANTLEIKGSSGRTLLQANVNDLGGGRRRLAVASTACEDDPRTIVTNDGLGRGFEVCGRDNEVYGMLIPDPSTAGCILLYCKERPVMKILKGPVELNFSAFDMYGTMVGSCSGGEGGEPWSLLVEPGQDAVLIVSCVLGLIRL